MGTFDDILECSVGPSTLELSGYSKGGQAVLDERGNRYATRISYTCTGTLRTSSASALATALGQFETACQGEDLDFSVSCFGSVAEQLLSADCIDGPRVQSFSYGAVAGHNLREVSFVVEGTRYHDGDADHILSETSTTRTSYNVEGLRTVATTGRVVTDGTVDASVGVLADKIPAEEAGWKLTYSYTLNDDADECDYEATRQELVNSYPAGAETSIVDGERTISTSYDDHNRKIVSYSYTFVGEYAQTYIDALHTSLRAAGGLRSASISSTYYQSRTVTGQFEVIDSRSGGSVLELTERISHSRSGPLLDELPFPGTTPLIIQAETPGYIYEQSGRAIGLGVFPQPPSYAFASANLESRDVTTSRINDTECEVSWRFTFRFAAEQDVQLPSQRSDSAGSYT